MEILFYCVLVVHQLFFTFFKENISVKIIVVLTVEAVEKREEVFSACAPSDDISQAPEEGAEAAVVDFEVRVEPPVTLFGSARFGLPQHEHELCDSIRSVRRHW